MRRNKFSLSRYKLYTGDMGVIIPVCWYEALPLDTIQQRTSLLIRISPLLSPVMHPVRVKIHHWFVPNRLIWDDWEDFITGGEDGLQTPEHPYHELNQWQKGNLTDYLGLAPPSGPLATNLRANSLPFRAYALIYNEWYRDQDIIKDKAPLSTASGLDSTTEITTRNAAWEKDYFTTARPWPDKGPSLSIPVQGAGTPTFQNAQIGTGIELTNRSDKSDAGLNTSGTGSPEQVLSWTDPAASIDIDEMRKSLALKRYQEARAEYGSRYVEYLRYIGVRNPSDARLQNPEFLGGSRSIIQFSEVLQTAEGTNPVATLRGHGINAMRTRRFRRFFEEHGIVMTVAIVTPKTMYNSNVARKWLRETKEDYFQKELQYIGEQELTNREAHLENTDPKGIFGYQNRYDEYKTAHSTIAGDFRDTLNYWHYARIYSGDVALNESFITAVPTKRVNADATGNPLWVMASHSIQARRAMAKYPKARTF